MGSQPNDWHRISAAKHTRQTQSSGAIWRAHARQSRPRRRRFDYRQPSFLPRIEPADHIGRIGKAEIDERCSGQQRRATVVAEEHETLLLRLDVWIAKRAVWGNAPFE